MSLVTAKALRHNMTDAERALWYRLRAKRFSGFKFRRQEPLGRYVVDFVCHEAGLIIELDGGQHALQESQDEARTRFLESRGYRVLRFWNDEVFGNLEGVLESVLAHVSPSPQPLSRQGRGAEPNAVTAHGIPLSPRGRGAGERGRGE